MAMKVHPAPGVHASSVHGLPSLQDLVTPWQPHWVQMSLSVQASPSLQPAPTWATESSHWPESGLQAVVTQASADGGHRTTLVGSRTQALYTPGGSSFLSTSAPETIIGLPSATERVDHIVMRLPDGTTAEVRNVPTRSRVVFGRDGSVNVR